MDQWPKNLSLLRLAINVIIQHTCQRWSTLVPVVVYLSLFIVVKYVAIPLRSSNGEHLQKGHFYKPNDEHQDNYFKKDSSSHVKLLADIFLRADENHDKYLNVNELSSWINTKTQEHINEAVNENYQLFTTIDINPEDGMISWTEYHNYFLKKEGLNKDYAGNESGKGLSRSLREAIIRDKAAWTETAKIDPDLLTMEEFLAFRHPESSHATILALVDDLLEKFDRDGDELLTEDEFAGLQNDPSKPNMMRPGEIERRNEFREILDRNKDGAANRQEIMLYIDPKNPRHGREEAETLIILADTNHDGKLSLIEVLNKMDLFLGSKMVDTAKSFHDEF